MKYPIVQYFGEVEVVYEFFGAMPTGVAVSLDKRIFVCFPKWGDDVLFTVGEIVDGNLIPYPNVDFNTMDLNHPSETLISVQSVYVDEKNILWILDTAAPNFSVPIKGGAKLIAIDLKTNQVIRKYVFSSSIVLDTTYLNDVRIDYSKKTPYAYITDSSTTGVGAIIVLNLETGEAFRRLEGDISTSANANFIPKVEGEILMNRDSEGTTTPVTLASDGIALDDTNNRLYYCSLSSRDLFYIKTDDLVNLNLSEQELSRKVHFVIEKGACDGMICDSFGNLYYGDYENNSIRVLKNNVIETIIYQPFLLWPDTFSLCDGYLYFIVNQLNRQKGYHYGIDKRIKPYYLFRINIR